MGINQIAAIAGSFIGLMLGGVLAVINWRFVFLVSVPFGIFGTIWAYLKLHETATIRAHQTIDWLGNHHLRRRADDSAAGHHLRHRAVRRLADGLGESRW